MQSCLQVDGKTFTFDGFCILSQVSLSSIPVSTVTRFGHQHSIQLIQVGTLKENEFSKNDVFMLQEFVFVEILELYDWVKCKSGTYYFV